MTKLLSCVIIVSRGLKKVQTSAINIYRRKAQKSLFNMKDIGYILITVCFIILLTFCASVARAQTVCAPKQEAVENFTNKHNMYVAAHAIDKDGDFIQFWVKPNGNWLAVYIPAHNASLICVLTGGQDWESFNNLKSGVL